MSPVGDQINIPGTFPRFDGDALCSEVDPERMFPEVGERAEAAKSICRRCAVTDQCLQWALDNDERWGVWGGMTEEERAKLRKRPRPSHYQQERVHGNEAGEAQHRRRGEPVCDRCKIGVREQRERRERRRGDVA